MESIPASDTTASVVNSRRRDEILELAAASSTPLGAAEIAARIGIHVTTARFHLEQLEAAGLVRREPLPATGRGRPRLAYAAAPQVYAETANRQLVETLARALADDADGGHARATRAGQRWADDLGLAHGDAAPASMALTEMLAQLGFDPVPGAPAESGAEVIELRACPFRATAAEFPDVVCAVHSGLIEQTMLRAGAGPADAELHAFVTPHLCTVTLLSRPA